MKAAAAEPRWRLSLDSPASSSQHIRALSNPHFRVAVVGHANVDLSLRVGSLPAPGQDMPASHAHWGSGGGALNAAVAYRTMGAVVSLICRVGKDSAADLALYTAKSRDVDLNLVQFDPCLPTGLCVVAVTPDGQRSFLSYRGANDNLSPIESPLQPIHLLHVSAYALTSDCAFLTVMQLVRHTHQCGGRVCVDLAGPIVQSRTQQLAELIQHTWYLVGNVDEIALLAPDVPLSRALAMLVRQGPQWVVVKQGAEGATIASNQFVGTAKPPPVHAVDTTACGDAFAAASAWVLLHRGDPLQALRVGNLLGSAAACQAGAADSIPVTLPDPLEGDI